MANSPERFPKVIAVVTGFVAAFIPGAFEPAEVSVAVVYLALGLALGFIWPARSWRWGLWIAGPLIALIGLSVAFSGYLEMFLKKDLPLIAIAVLMACSGGFAGGWWKSRRRGAAESPSEKIEN